KEIAVVLVDAYGRGAARLDRQARNRRAVEADPLRCLHLLYPAHLLLKQLVIGLVVISHGGPSGTAVWYNDSATLMRPRSGVNSGIATRVQKPTSAGKSPGPSTRPR